MIDLNKKQYVLIAVEDGYVSEEEKRNYTHAVILDRADTKTILNAIDRIFFKIHGDNDNESRGQCVECLMNDGCFMDEATCDEWNLVAITD